MATRYKHTTALNYFIKHQTALCEKYLGKELLMRGAKVIGAFDTFHEAMNEGRKLFGEENFTVHECTDEQYPLVVSPLLGAFA